MTSTDRAGAAAAEPRPRAVWRAHKDYAYHVGAAVSLPVPEPPSVECFAALLRRRTTRAFAPLATPALSVLLWYAARTLEMDSAPPGTRGRWEHRVAPSAGGRHPVDVLVMRPEPAAGADGARAGSASPGHEFWWYDGLRHTLRPLLPITPAARAGMAGLAELPARILGAVPGLADATVLWHAAQFERTAAAYDGAESLVWRDAGCLLGVTVVVAAALDLACCPLGATGEPFVSAAVGAPGGEVLGVGGVVVGARRGKVGEA